MVAAAAAVGTVAVLAVNLVVAVAVDLAILEEFLRAVRWREILRCRILVGVLKLVRLEMVMR